MILSLTSSILEHITYVHREKNPSSKTLARHYLSVCVIGIILYALASMYIDYKASYIWILVTVLVLDLLYLYLINEYYYKKGLVAQKENGLATAMLMFPAVSIAAKSFQLEQAS